MTNSILQGKKLISPVGRIKPGENIKYLLLIKSPDSDETYWEIITGREEAYNYIKNNIEIIDVTESFIIANKMKNFDLDDLRTIHDFILFVKESNNIVDDFDIDSYVQHQESNINNVSDIGVGLETKGDVFTGVAGSYYSEDEQE